MQRRATKTTDNRRRIGWLGAGALAATLVVALLVALAPDSERRPAAGSATVALIGGIPQRGPVLGDPRAPVTLAEFADLQCPFCRAYATDVLPQIIRRYVRTGKVRLVFHPLAFIGPDSERAARFAAGAAEQNRLWHVVDRLYANQGAENSGWVSPEVLSAISKEVPGLDATKVLASSLVGARATRLLRQARTQAAAANVKGTPSFLVGLTGGKLSAMPVKSLDIDSFSSTLDQMLAMAR